MNKIFLKLFILVMIFYETATSTESPWKLAFSYSYLDFSDVASNGSIIVAVGNTDSVLVIQNDTSCYFQKVIGMNGIKNILWFKNLFIAVGEMGAIWTSTDGQLWTRQNSGTTKNLNSIYGDTINNLLVAVGDSGIILSSKNANDWKEQMCNSTANLRQVIQAKNNWVICANYDTILYSADAISWKELDIDTAYHNKVVSQLATNGYDIIAIGGGSYSLANNCSTWTCFNFICNFPLEQAYYKDSLWIVGDGQGTILKSQDLINWDESKGQERTKITKVINNQSISITIGTQLSDKLRFDRITKDTVVIFKPDYYQSFKAGCWTGDKIIIVGTGGLILKSQDMKLWKKVNSTIREDLNGVTCFNNMIIAVGNRGAIVTSIDGENWNVVNSNIKYSLFKIIASNQKVVAIGNETIVSSDNGIDWQVVMADSRNSDIAWSGKEYLLRNAGFSKSPDAINWSVCDFHHIRDNPMISYSLYIGSNIIYSDKLGYLALGAKFNIEGYISADGILWDYFSLPNGFNYGPLYSNENQIISPEFLYQINTGTWSYIGPNPQIFATFIFSTNTDFVLVNSIGKIFILNKGFEKIINSNHSTHNNYKVILTVANKGPSVKVDYTLSCSDHLKIQLFDIRGKLLKTLLNDYKKVGNYSLDLKNLYLSAGIYTILIKSSKSGAISGRFFIK